MKTPDTANAVPSALDRTVFNKAPKFTPRQKRALWGLWNRSLMRGELNRVAGASNGPQVIFELRGKGIDIHCEKVEVVDRDGKPCLAGKYTLTNAGRATLRSWNRGPEQ